MDEASTVVVAESTSTAVSEEEHLTFSWYPIVIAIFTLQTLTVAVGNSMTIYAYWTTPSLHKSLHNLLICNLSIADLMVALTGTPFYLISYTEAGIKYVSSKYECLTMMMSINISINMSLAAISILCIERFVAVIYPYRYYTVVTEKSVRWAIALSYIVAFVPATPPVLGWNHWQPGNPCRAVYAHPKEFVACWTTFRVVVIFVSVTMNVCIAKVAFTKNRTPVTEVNGSGNKSGQSDKNLTGGHYRVTKMLLTVFGVYYVCWMPFVILTAMYRRNTDRSTAFIICHDFAMILVGLNSCINPMIYSKSNTGFRQAFKKIHHRICPQP